MKKVNKAIKLIWKGFWDAYCAMVAIIGGVIFLMCCHIKNGWMAIIFFLGGLLFLICGFLFCYDIGIHRQKFEDDEKAERMQRLGFSREEAEQALKGGAE